MKKWIAAALVVVVLFCFMGCAAQMLPESVGNNEILVKPQPLTTNENGIKNLLLDDAAQHSLSRFAITLGKDVADGEIEMAMYHYGEPIEQIFESLAQFDHVDAKNYVLAALVEDAFQNPTAKILLQCEEDSITTGSPLAIPQPIAAASFTTIEEAVTAQAGEDVILAVYYFYTTEKDEAKYPMRENEPEELQKDNSRLAEQEYAVVLTGRFS